jgi:GntR family transcriptional repressor for pyruvate dehydrogenase complex
VKAKIAPSLTRQIAVKIKNPVLVKSSSTADRVAIILREQILSLQEATYMGSEADIAAEVGVSLPILRQAARMLESEELLKIKPGKGGGYFTRRPTIETAMRSASQFLSPKDLNSNSMFMDVADPIVNQIVIAAVSCEDKDLINELMLFVEGQLANSKNSKLSPDYSFKISADLITLLAQMSNNILLELFARILWDEISVSNTAGTFEETQKITLSNYSTRLGVAEAVLAKDKDKAISAWRKRSKFLRSCPKRGFELTRKRSIA